jgi:plastocyanin
MNKKNKLITIAIIAIVFVGTLLFVKDISIAPSKETQTKTPASTFPTAVDIVYHGYGFSPDDTAVAPGASVKIINESSHELHFASDPHPANSANPEMNIGVIASGESKMFTITQVGAWGYHNHLSPLKRGRIAVLNRVED